MAEIIVEPMLFSQAKKYLVDLMDKSGAFRGGSKPFVGTLEKSYGYRKIIGCNSFDNQVNTRLDYDEEKGYHFNFANYNTGEKICLPIEDMTQSQYENYIDSLTTGRNTDIIPKGSIIKYRKGTNERIYYALQYDADIMFIEAAIHSGYLIDENLEDNEYERARNLLSKFYDLGNALGIDVNDIIKINDASNEIIVFDCFYFEYLCELILMYIDKNNRNNESTIKLINTLLAKIKPAPIPINTEKMDELKEKMNNPKSKNINRGNSATENKKHGR